MTHRQLAKWAGRYSAAGRGSHASSDVTAWTVSVAGQPFLQAGGDNRLSALGSGLRSS